VTLTANTSALSGTRVLTSVGGAANLTGTSTTSETYNAVVTETAAKGVNGWEVDEQLVCSAADVTAGCSAASPSLHGATGSTPIPATSISEAGGSGFQQTTLAPIVNVSNGTSGTDSATGAGGTLNSVTRVYVNSSQNTANNYSAIHNATANLTVTPPNGTVQTIYTGTIQVTLWQ
jgi:hypothetical protein